MNPSLSSGSTGSSRSKRKSPWKGRLVLILLLVGIGFYLGVRTTLRVAAGSPDFLKRVFGVADWQKMGELPPPAKLAPVPAPAAGATAPPVNTPPTNTVPLTAQTTSPTPVTTTGTPPSPSVAPVANDEVSRMVSDYNKQLYQVQSVFGDFAKARTDSKDSALPAERVQAAGERLTALSDEVASAVQKAQSQYEALQRIPQVKQSYRDGDMALKPEEVRAAFPEMSVENLRFLVAR